MVIVKAICVAGLWLMLNAWAQAYLISRRRTAPGGAIHCRRHRDHCAVRLDLARIKPFKSCPISGTRIATNQGYTTMKTRDQWGSAVVLSY